MKSLRYLAVLGLCPLIALADQDVVDMETAMSGEVVNPWILQPFGSDTDGFSTRGLGQAKGQPGKAEVQRIYDQQTVIAGSIFIPSLPLPEDCTGAEFAWEVTRHEITLIFADLSGIFAALDDSGPTYFCFHRQDGPWFSRPLKIGGGTGKYLNATGELDLIPGGGEDNGDVSVPGLRVVSGALQGLIITN